MKTFLSCKNYQSDKHGIFYVDNQTNKKIKHATVRVQGRCIFWYGLVSKIEIICKPTITD